MKLYMPHKRASIRANRILAACLLTSATAVQADFLDGAPHILIQPVATKLGDFVVKFEGSAETGTTVTNANDKTILGGFVGASFDVDTRHKLENGWITGARLNLSAAANVHNDDTVADQAEADLGESTAIAFVSGPWGRMEAGLLDKVSFAVKGSSAQTGYADLALDSINPDADVSALGARYTVNYGPHNALAAIDARLSAKLGYFFKRPIQAFNYTFGVEALYNKEVASNLAGLGDVQTFGAQAGLQVDYGRLFIASGAGYEHQSAINSDDSENRVFASLGASNKFGRLTASVGSSVSYFTRSKQLNTSSALGAEYALSRGITLLAGYNLGINRKASVGTTPAETSFTNELKVGARLTF